LHHLRTLPPPPFAGDKLRLGDDAPGEWRDRDTSEMIKERSKDVTVIVPQDADVKGKINAIVTAYKDRFKQQSSAL
jgi:hypothetical protein